MAGKGNKKGSKKTEGSGRKSGTANKLTLLASEILKEVKHSIESVNPKKGYDPIKMQVLFIEKAVDAYENLPPREGAVYLKMAMTGNEKLMDKLHGSRQTITTDSTITPEEIVEAMTAIEFKKGYKPIDDPSNNLGGKKEDDL